MIKPYYYEKKYTCQIAKPKKLDDRRIDRITRKELLYNYEQIAEDFDGLPEIESLFEVFN
jgi:hypothetical protein